MKKSLLFLSAAVLALSTVFISACSDDEGGGGQGVIPPDLIKSLTINRETWEFVYDEANNDRLKQVNYSEVSLDGGDPYTVTFTYDYSVAGKLTEKEADAWGEYTTVFVLDSKGRIIKQEREDANDFDGFEYNSDGYLIRWYRSTAGVEKNKWTATVVGGNIAVHTEYKDDGVTVSRTKTFTYLAAAGALNVSNLPQANLRNSERRTVSGLYGTGSLKLVDYLEINNPTVATDYRKNKNTYSFDSKNRVATITRTGVDKDGIATDLNEVFEYTYYDKD